MGSNISLINVAFLVFLRVLGALAVFPFIRSYLRISGTAIIAAAVTGWIMSRGGVVGLELPTTSAGFAAFVDSPILFALLCARELGAGLLLTAPLAIALEVMPMAGRLVDDARGAQFAEQVNPEIGRVSQLQELGNLITPIIFFKFAFMPLCSTLSQSVWDSASAANVTAAEGSVSAQLADQLIRIVASTLGESLSFAAPVILICLILDLAIGLLSRFLVRINLNHEFVPVKLVLGVFVYGVFLINVSEEIPQTILSVIGQIFRS